MKDHWKSFDCAAILTGLTAMTVFFFAGSGGTAETVVCTVLGVAGLAYLGGALTMWFRRRIEFDLMLVKGSFLRRVVCLVVLLPFSMTFAVMLCGLGPEQMLPSADNAEEFGIFWSVFYHFIDPGNQHMTQNAAARGWTAVLAVFGIILLAGLLVSTLINWFDKRREQWYGGKIRYSAGQTGEDFAIVIGANEIVASVIRNLLAGESDDIDFRRERANRHVLLQTAGNPEELRDRLASQLPAGELDRVVIYNARRDSAEEIAALHPQLATEIYVLGENAGDDGGESPHDALNMKCVNLLAAELSKHSGAHRKVCKVLFEYQTTFSIFQFSDIPREVRDRLVFIPFNRYECWAQRVMVDGSYADLTFPGGAVSYTPLDGFGGLSSDSEEFVHFIVVGMSKMGVAMGIEAAFQAHYPNFRKARTRISFIASDADREMEFMKGRYRSLFGLARHRYLDAAACGAGAFAADRGWTDPMAAPDCRWKHLGEDGNFIDTEFEFIKGEIESAPVREYLRVAASERNARLTVAVCLNRISHAIAAALYLPSELYRKVQQIWVYQKEASDIVANLNGAPGNDGRYAKLRPFGMSYGEYMRNRSSYIKSVLVNGVYIFDGKNAGAAGRDMADKSTWKDLRDAWKECTVYQQWSNRYFVDSMYQKLRSVCGRLPDDLFAVPGLEDWLDGAIAAAGESLAECEHNRWNMQQLLMEFSPADREQDAELCRMAEDLQAALPSLEAWRKEVGWYHKDDAEKAALKNSESYRSMEYGRIDTEFDARKKALKFGPDRVHPNICSFAHLDRVDPGAKPYDSKLNRAIPAILIMVDGHGKVRLKEKE